MISDASQNGQPIDQLQTEYAIGSSPEGDALTQSSAESLMFVDSSVDQIDTLISEVQQGIKVIVLDDDGEFLGKNELGDSVEVLAYENSNGVEAVANYLSGYQDLSSLHFVTHGEDGSIKLGNATLDINTLTSYSEDLSTWGQALAADGDILFYGCNIAAGQEGTAFLDDISTLTGADIAASDDLTGSSALGGDWVLEVKNGTIESAGAFNKSVEQSYQAILPQPMYSDTTESGRLANTTLQTSRNYGINVVNNPAGDGRVIHFDLRRGDPMANGGTRSEIVPRNMDIRWGRTYTYTFDTFIPQDWQNDRSLEHITQWHSFPDSNLGEPWRRPPISLHVQGNKVELGVYHDARRVSGRRTMTGGNVWEGDLVKGRWESWTFEMTYSFNNDGLIRMWRNGQLELVHRGPNAYNDASPPFVKHGIYKPDWNPGQTGSTSNRRHYFMDNIQHFEGTLNAPTTVQQPTVNTDTTTTQEEPVVTTTATTQEEPVVTTTTTMQEEPSASQAMRIEAEDMVLNNYQVTAGNFASGGAYADLLGQVTAGESGTASYTFDGPGGTYDIVVGYYDEADGNSPWSVGVDGTEIDRWNANSTNGNNNVASNASFRTRTIASQQLAAGDVITVTGTTNSGEFARFDYIEFVPQATAPTTTQEEPAVTTTTTTQEEPSASQPVPSESQPVRIEAEDMELNNYQVTAGNFASGGAYADLLGQATDGGSGTASYTFNGPGGTYDIVVGYYDEADGNSPWSVGVDGTEIDRWNANSTNGNNNVASNASFRTRTIASQQLAAGDVITVTGTTNAGEFARFDYIEFIPRSTTPSSSGTGEGVITTTEVAPSATTQAAINFEQTYQAEDATLDRASIKSGIANADGEYAHLWKTTASSASDGIEWTIDVPVAGFYQLDWKYGLSEKYAANAPLDLIVNGDRSETLEFSNTGRWLNWETTSRTVYLEAGANTIRLEGTGFGSANIDWMKVTGVSD